MELETVVQRLEDIGSQSDDARTQRMVRELIQDLKRNDFGREIPG